MGELLETLTFQQQKILSLRFGLAGGEPLSLTQIGDRFSLSRERIRQMERKAIKELRQGFSQLDRSEGMAKACSFGLAETDEFKQIELFQGGDEQAIVCSESFFSTAA